MWVGGQFFERPPRGNQLLLGWAPRPEVRRLGVTRLWGISLHPVEDALDAVVEAAMRNSVDIRV